MGQLVDALHYKPASSGEFFIGIIVPAALWPHLTELGTKNISYGDKGGRCIWLTTLPSSCTVCLEIWEP